MNSIPGPSSSSVASLTGLGTGVATALGVNVGSSGAFVVLGGALGTPSSGTLTNCTGLPAASITPGTFASGAFAFQGTVTLAGGTALIWSAAGGFGNAGDGIFQLFTNGFATNVNLQVIAANVLGVINGSNACSLRVFGNATKYVQLAHNGTNATLNVSSGNLLISSLPTANPGAGILWNNGGTPAIGT